METDMEVLIKKIESAASISQRAINAKENAAEVTQDANHIDTDALNAWNEFYKLLKTVIERYDSAGRTDLGQLFAKD